MNDVTGDYGFTDSSPRVTLSNGRLVGDIVWAAKNSYWKGKVFGLFGRRTDSLWRVNVRIQKNFTFSKFKLAASVDFFNVLNAVAYGAWLSNDVRSPNYSIPSTASAPRAAQMNLRVTF